MNRPQLILLSVGVVGVLSGVVLAAQSHPWLAGIMAFMLGWLAFSGIDDVKGD